MQDVDFFTFLITYNIKKFEFQGKISPFPLEKKGPAWVVKRGKKGTLWYLLKREFLDQMVNSLF